MCLLGISTLHTGQGTAELSVLTSGSRFVTPELDGLTPGSRFVTPELDGLTACELEEVPKFNPLGLQRSVLTSLGLGLNMSGTVLCFTTEGDLGHLRGELNRRTEEEGFT